ncbi:MAG: ABC transporter ATP-binding protein [Chloroflexota bacterium]|nr:ABC transporter ATP-binding protein [Chloroflexota bacterium]
MTATLEVRDLRVRFPTRRGMFAAVDGVNFEVQPGETLGVVGESGSGKSLSMLAILGLLPPGPPWEVTGQAFLNGRDLLRLSAEELRRVRGGEVAMIFQNPTSSLNPVFTVGDQVGEAIWVHNPSASVAEVRDRVVRLMELVDIPNPGRRVQQYPHEFSGGMAQRVMIAMALANSPSLLIADEPTTALDVTIQAQILQVLRDALREFNTSLVLITHNLSLVAELADRVAVMYAGGVIEAAAVEELFHHPRHPYTVGLMRSVPSLEVRAERLVQIPGQQPSPANRPSGCPFHPRCYLFQDRQPCVSVPPPLDVTDVPRHLSACHFWNEVETAGVLAT